MKKTKDINNNPVVTVVVLSYNRAEYTLKTLEAITTIDAGIDFELIVVDNGSDKVSVDLLKEWDKTGFIDKLILLPENLGTSPGFNKGFSYANEKTRFLTKLDNDITVTAKDWLLNIVNTLDNENNVGIAATDMKNHSALKELPIITLESGREVKDWSGFRAGGGGMTFTKELFSRLGGFEEKYPSDLKLMPDDIEFHHKVTEAGLHSYYICASESLMQKEHEGSYTSYGTWKARQYHLLKTRFFKLARGKEYFQPFISDVCYNKNTFKREERLILDLDITCFEDQLCKIGMSLRNTKTKEYVSDIYSDIIVTARKGKTTYIRWFYINKNIEDGEYEVVLSLTNADSKGKSIRFDFYKEVETITVIS